jgi:hypothetical protein
MTENFDSSAEALQKGYFMHRFTFLAGIALLCVPAPAAPQPQPPSISVCSGAVCLDRLRWVRSEAGALSSISGLLINNSPTATLSTVSLQFNLISGRVLIDTAVAFFSGEIPPGARWSFNAHFIESQGNSLVTRTESGLLNGVATDASGARHFSLPLKFDPVFNPWNRQERKEWELIHGKRDQ